MLITNDARSERSNPRDPMRALRRMMLNDMTA